MTHNQNTAFKARYDSLGSKFNGKTLDDYVNGQSFCCNEKNLDEIEQNGEITAENAKLEDNLYFYHPDHLGSTNLITNFDGEVTQSVAYIPYGEVFVEERNGSWATPFLFNAKELDEETGLYYYGARYYDPTGISWLSVDPKWGDYKGVSPYAYCLNNPVKLVDPDGEFAWVPFLLKAAAALVTYAIVSDELETNETNSNTSKEIGYAMQNPIDAMKVGQYKYGSDNISTYAGNFQINIAKYVGLSSGNEGDQGNAIRHTLWQSMITNSISEEDARRIGYSHESGVTDLSQRTFYGDDALSQADQTIDLLNNEIGRKIGKENKGASNKTLAKKVMHEFYKNGLWTAKSNKNGSVSIQKTKISKEQYEKSLEIINKKGENGLNIQ